jgi:hypothetical protein
MCFTLASNARRETGWAWGCSAGEGVSCSSPSQPQHDVAQAQAHGLPTIRRSRLSRRLTRLDIAC